jgi:hypothetical protein
MDKYIKVRDPNTGEIVDVANPYYQEGGLAPQENAEGGEEEGEGEEQQRGPWCSIVNNFCPECDECVWWLNGEDDEGNDTSSCIKVAEAIAGERANEAQAEFYERAQMVLDSMLSADAKSSALGIITNRLATLLLLSNEKAMSSMPDGVSLDSFQQDNVEENAKEEEEIEV